MEGQKKRRLILKVSYLCFAEIDRIQPFSFSVPGLTDCLTGLANITFAWMVEQCKPYLAFNQFTNATLSNYLQRMIEDDAEQAMRKEEVPKTSMVNKAVNTITEDLSATKKWLSSWFVTPTEEKAAPQEKLVRTYCFGVSKVPPYEPDHWTFFRNQDSYTRMYQAISSAQDRTPGDCDDRSTEAHKPLRDLGETHEWIHPSVQWRQKMSDKETHIKCKEPCHLRPEALQSARPQKYRDEYKEDDFKYVSKPLEKLRYTQKDGVYGWVHKEKSDVWIPEWPIEAAIEEEDPSCYHENAEMALVDACLDNSKVREFLKEHAEAWNKVNVTAK